MPTQKKEGAATTTAITVTATAIATNLSFHTSYTKLTTVIIANVNLITIVIICCICSMASDFGSLFDSG